MSSVREVFDEVYRTNRWAGTESLSGPGSGLSATYVTRVAVQQLVAALGITSVLDVACGDGYWMPELPRYVGMDVSPQAITRAQRLHPERTYVVADATDEWDTKAELVICRDAMQHLPLELGEQLLRRITRSGTRWLLASTFWPGENVDVEVGGAYSPDLTAEPFDLWMPMAMVFDGWSYDEPGEVRDPRKFLGLWRLRE